MRVLCFGDLHLGAGYEHRKDALADAEAILDQIVAIAIERGVSLILNAGDTFHRAKPEPAALHVFKRFCDQLADTGILMVALGGNGLHESAPGQKSALELFESRWVRVSRTPEYISEFAGVTVCTLPAATVGRLAAAQGSGDRAELNAQAVELLLRAARDLFATALEQTNGPRILLAHQMVSGASLPTGLAVEQIGSVVLPVEKLERIGYDAIVLGDIHQMQALGNGYDITRHQPQAFYCGSPMCMDFGEADVPHGCWLLDVEVGGAIATPITLADRRFVTIDVDLTQEPGVLIPGWLPRSSAQDSSGEGAASHNAERGLARLHAEGVPERVPPGMRAPNPAGASLDETDILAAEIVAQGNGLLRDAVVRVRYRATEEQHRRVDQPALLRLLEDAGVHRIYGGLQWLPVRESRTRSADLDETLAPLDSVALWMTAAGEDDGGLLMALTAAYLEAIA